MKANNYNSRRWHLGIYLSLLFSVLFISNMNAQDYVITSAESWLSNQTLSTNVIVDAGGTLTISAGVVVGFNYADVNADSVGDFRIEVRNGGKIIVNGTSANPVIFQGAGSTPPAYAGKNKWWQGLVMTSTTGSSLNFLTIKNVTTGMQIAGPISVDGINIDSVSVGIVVNNTLGGTVDINIPTLTNITGKGIVVNNGTTNIRYATLTNITDNGIEVNTPNVTIDWAVISNATTGIFNAATATNTVVTNSSVTGNTKSGLFNLDGTVTVTNSIFNNNAFHGIVNSSGTLTLTQSDVSNNVSRGILIGGTSTSTIKNITDTANGNVGVDIIPQKQTADVLVPAGTVETSPSVSFLYSNIYNNSKTSSPANLQVRSLTTTSTPVADFTTNWWGVATGVPSLVSALTPGTINYANWRIIGVFAVGATAILNPTKSIAITYPETGILGGNAQIPIRWSSVGKIPLVVVKVDSAGVGTTFIYKVVPNTGAYTITGPYGVLTNTFAVKSVADTTILSTKTITSVAYNKSFNLLKPLSAASDTVLGGQQYTVKWASIPTITKVKIVLDWKASDFTGPDQVVLANNIDATLGSYSVTLPNTDTASVTSAIKIYDVTSGSVADSSIATGFTYLAGTPWAVTPTGFSMTIAVDTLLLLDQLNGGDGIKAFYRESNNVFVGAFYNNQCVGYARGINPPATGTTFNRAITIWGDDPTTSGVKEGPANGDVVSFKIWLPTWTSDSTARISTTTTVPASTDSANTITYALNTYATYGQLFYRNSYGYAASGTDTTVKILSTNPTAGAWYLISSFTVPQVSTAASVLDCFSAVGNGTVKGATLVIAKNGRGQVYWPSVSVNTIDPAAGPGWEKTTAYYIKLAHATLPTDTLFVVGNRIDPVATPIQLSTGWNYAAYLRKSDMNIATALSSISKYLVIVKQDDGKIYWPAYSINEIGNMTAGRGYLIKVTDATTLIYPSNTYVAKDAATQSPKNTEHYIVNANSDNSSTIGILDAALKGKVLANDEVGVFNSDNVLVGSAVYNGGNLAVVAWGLESGAKKGFGMKEGEAYTIKVWSKATGKETILTGITYTMGAGVYSNNGISVIAKVEGLINAVPTEFAVSQNYPNPFNPSTMINFALPADSKVRIAVYNVLGQLVTNLVNTDMKAGYHQVSFNASGLASGIYFYQINAGKFNETKKMNLLK